VTPTYIGSSSSALPVPFFILAGKFHNKMQCESGSVIDNKYRHTDSVLTPDL